MQIETLKNNKWLAEYLNVSNQTARTLHLKTDIPAIKIGRLIRYRPAAVEQWVNNLQSKKRPGGRP